MIIPNEQAYIAMLNRLEDAMRHSCEELADVAASVQGANSDASLRLLKLAKTLERIGNDPNDPVPSDIAEGQPA